METYLFLRAVEGLEPGIYHFRPNVFDPECLKKGDRSRELAEALRLGVCAIGALFDDKVNRIIGVDGVEETVIYMATVGWTQRREWSD